MAVSIQNPFGYINILPLDDAQARCCVGGIILYLWLISHSFSIFSAFFPTVDRTGTIINVN